MAVSTEMQVQMAARLYDARTTLIRLVPSIYPERIKLWQDLVRQMMATRKLNVVQAAFALAQERSQDGMAQLWILAAAVEILEPLEPVAASTK